MRYFHCTPPVEGPAMREQLGSERVVVEKLAALEV
jgi:hypothetical protein